MALCLRRAPVVRDVDVAASAAATAVGSELLACRGGGTLHAGAAAAVAVPVEGHLPFKAADLICHIYIYIYHII